MVKINLQYLGELRCQATHGPSGTQLITDAPVDNHGKGESFSPTDLVATALGACMLTLMGIVAERHQINLRGTEVQVEKHMSPDTPRRIAKLTVHFESPAKLSDQDKKLLENAAMTCPVYQSLHPSLEKDVQFLWK